MGKDRSQLQVANQLEWVIDTDGELDPSRKIKASLIMEYESRMAASSIKVLWVDVEYS